MGGGTSKQEPDLAEQPGERTPGDGGPREITLETNEAAAKPKRRGVGFVVAEDQSPECSVSVTLSPRSECRRLKEELRAGEEQWKNREAQLMSTIMQLKYNDGSSEQTLTRAGLRKKWEADNTTRWSWHEKKTARTSMKRRASKKNVSGKKKMEKLKWMKTSLALGPTRPSGGKAYAPAEIKTYVQNKMSEAERKQNAHHWDFKNIQNSAEGGRMGVLLFTGFESLDAFGPLEMFSLLGRIKPINLVTVGYQIDAYTKEEYKGSPCTVQADPVDRGTGAALPRTFGPQVICDYSIDNCPHLDALIIPGGMGSRDLILAKAKESKLFKWIKEVAEKATLVVSVCTGAVLLAETGLLDRVQATTNKKAFDWVAQQRIQVNWMRAPRWVEDGKFVTSGGVSAGTDVALHCIQLMYGMDVAYSCASMAEYDWDSNPSHPMLKTCCASNQKPRRHSQSSRDGAKDDEELDVGDMLSKARGEALKEAQQMAKR
jgi:putative intracellular protease/amidase